MSGSRTIKVEIGMNIPVSEFIFLLEHDKNTVFINISFVI